LLAIWMLYNGGRDSGRFDPYPYILLKGVPAEEFVTRVERELRGELMSDRHPAP
jgi:hypothetical protein